MKAEKLADGSVAFQHYSVIKKAKNYYAVMYCGMEITSGRTLENACKKAKLLEKGFQHAKEIFFETY